MLSSNHIKALKKTIDNASGLLDVYSRTKDDTLVPIIKWLLEAAAAAACPDPVDRLGDSIDPSTSVAYWGSAVQWQEDDTLKSTQSSGSKTAK